MKFIGSFPDNTTLADITGVTAGTGLSGGGTSGAVTLNLDISSLSEVTPANGDTILMLDSDGATEQRSSVANLATLFAGEGLTADTSVLSVSASQGQVTSLGTLTGLTIDGDKDVTPGDGAMLHIDTSTITDNNTSASGTASLYTHARIEGPTLAATNASVTTTDAATLYITRPAAGTNQTVTNSWGIYTNGAIRCGNITNSGSTGYSQTAGDMTLYDATNNGNPTISLGSSATERLKIESQIKDSLVNIMQNGKLTIGNVDILSDSSGTTTLNNIDALDATTEATIESAIDTLSNLTTVGTIGTGVWNATKILSSKTTHVIHYSFKGTCTGIASGNFQYAEDMLDAQYPFQLNTDYGNTVIANGDLSDVSTYFRSSGTVMPRACTAIDMVGWGSCAGTGEVTISLCKVTPTRDDSTTDPTPVVVATTTFTALNSNDKLENFSVGNSAGDGAVTIVTSAIAAGDILMPFVISPNTKAMYFNMTLDVEV